MDELINKTIKLSFIEPNLHKRLKKLFGEEDIIILVPPDFHKLIERIRRDNPTEMMNLAVKEMLRDKSLNSKSLVVISSGEEIKLLKKYCRKVSRW